MFLSKISLCKVELIETQYSRQLSFDIVSRSFNKEINFHLIKIIITEIMPKKSRDDDSDYSTNCNKQSKVSIKTKKQIEKSSGILAKN